MAPKVKAGGRPRKTALKCLAAHCSALAETVPKQIIVDGDTVIINHLKDGACKKSDCKRILKSLEHVKTFADLNLILDEEHHPKYLTKSLFEYRLFETHKVFKLCIEQEYILARLFMKNEIQQSIIPIIEKLDEKIEEVKAKTAPNSEYYKLYKDNEGAINEVIGSVQTISKRQRIRPSHLLILHHLHPPRFVISPLLQRLLI